MLRDELQLSRSPQQTHADVAQRMDHLASSLVCDDDFYAHQKEESTINVSKLGGTLCPERLKKKQPQTTKTHHQRGGAFPPGKTQPPLSWKAGAVK